MKYSLVKKTMDNITVVMVALDGFKNAVLAQSALLSLSPVIQEEAPTKNKSRPDTRSVDRVTNQRDDTAREQRSRGSGIVRPQITDKVNDQAFSRVFLSSPIRKKTSDGLTNRTGDSTEDSSISSKLQGSKSTLSLRNK